MPEWHSLGVVGYGLFAPVRTLNSARSLICSSAKPSSAFALIVRADREVELMKARKPYLI